MAKSWYFLMTTTGWENKVERTIRLLLEKNELDPAVVTEVKVPVEEIAETKDGKTKIRKDKFMPGYVMIELDLPELEWKKTCNTLRHISGVAGFVGTKPNERPRPITSDEAKNILLRCGDIKGEKVIRVKQAYSVGDQVKIIEGPFATFTGTVEEVSAEKDKLRVNVQIFGRATPVEVSLLQVEKV